MGCVCYRDLNFSLEEEFYNPFELCLGFHTQKAAKILLALKKSTLINYITEKCLENISHDFSINYLKHPRFFISFRSSKEDLKYDPIRLSILTLLLTKDTPNLKASLLFELLNPNKTDFLTQENITFIITQLLNISCEIIPSYVSTLHLGNTDLQNYNFKFKCVSKRTALEISEDFVCDSGLVTNKSFVERFVRKFGFLASPQESRKHCFEVYNWAIKPVEQVLTDVGQEEVSKWDEDVMLTNSKSLPVAGKKRGTKKLKEIRNF